MNQIALKNELARYERRTAPRTALRRRITLALPNGTIIRGETMDLSTGGMRVAIQDSLNVPLECTFDLTVLIEGKLQPLRGSGKISSCVCRGMLGFSVGVQFTQLDASARALVTQMVA